jgi:hypothetical protein
LFYSKKESISAVVIRKGINLVVSTYLTIINIKFYKNANLFRALILSIVAKVRYKPKDEAC